jgi:hypothetical protein
LIIEDNLSIHTSRQVQMALLAQPDQTLVEAVALPGVEGPPV